MRASILWRRLLRGGLTAGGLLDLALAGWIFTRSAAAIALPEPIPFYLRAGAVLLAALGGVGLVTANEPQRFSPLVWVVATARLLLAALLGPAAGSTEPHLLAAPPPAFFATEFALGLTVLLTHWRLRR